METFYFSLAGDGEAAAVMDAEGIDHLKMMNVVRESGAAVEKVWNAFDQLVIFYRARDVV